MSCGIMPGFPDGKVSNEKHANIIKHQTRLGKGYVNGIFVGWASVERSKYVYHKLPKTPFISRVFFDCCFSELVVAPFHFCVSNQNK
jgi:hypothetical protein